MNYTRCFLVVFFISILGHAQKSNSENLIENPSFETFLNCPRTLGNLEDDVLHWKSPTMGSTDYFNGCSDVMGTPKNFNGEQPADFGIGYIGLYFYAPEDYREYVQASLVEPLKKDVTYKLSFYVSLAERSDFAIKAFGIQFTQSPVSVPTRKVLSRMHLSKVSGDVSNYFEIKYSDFYSDKKDWVLVEKEFVANGTEQYMIIGNFKSNKRTQKFRTKRNVTQGSYYYLDMVRITTIDDHGNSSKDKSEKVLFKLDEINTFKDILFDFDTFVLVPSARKELEEIAAYLADNLSLKIRINGHTDGTGSEAYNKLLSENRAKAVAQYFINAGITSDRISYAGLGSEKPVKENTTSAGRKTNRRVEFVIFY
ncbi:OmpA family protein [Maribacter sp. R77961]|uniref:OmpA family protein n=1 Tax=Maribacter sp. R77961 TaxID=3093871 RepID=UPI0037C6A7C9